MTDVLQLPPKLFRRVVVGLLALAAAGLAAGLSLVIGFVLRSPTYGWTGDTASPLALYTHYHAG